jgi:hypothetical protein
VSLRTEAAPSQSAGARASRPRKTRPRNIVSTHAVGTLHTGGWNEQYNYGLWGGWWRIKDLVAKANAPVSIVSRDPGKLDVFSVRNDGAVMAAAWDQDVAEGAWRGWWSIAGGVTVPGGARPSRASGTLVLIADGRTDRVALEEVLQGAWARLPSSSPNAHESGAVLTVLVCAGRAVDDARALVAVVLRAGMRQHGPFGIMSTLYMRSISLVSGFRSACVTTSLNSGSSPLAFKRLSRSSRDGYPRM